MRSFERSEKSGVQNPLVAAGELGAGIHRQEFGVVV